MALQALIFDFDLTLVDSRLGIRLCHTYALQTLQLPDVDANAERAVTLAGQPPHQVFVQLFPDRKELAQEYFRLYQERALQVMTTPGTTLLPGAREMLEAFNEAGVKLGIVSNKLRIRVEEYLAHDNLSHLFDVVVGPDDTGTYKPEPNGLRLALKQLGVPARDALYVGDTLIDAKTAARGGVAFIAFLNEYTDFEGVNAVARITSLDQLPMILLPL